MLTWDIVCEFCEMKLNQESGPLWYTFVEDNFLNAPAPSQMEKTDFRGFIYID